MLPRVETYYPRGNSANAVKVEMDGMTLWFSYSTLVAFQVGGNPRVVIENYWGPTTGRHLRAIDGCYSGDQSRVSRADFDRLWTEQTQPQAAPLATKGN
jgi:hypothetical protein